MPATKTHPARTIHECDYLNGWIKKRSHTQKISPKSGEPQRYSWGTQKKKQNKTKKPAQKKDTHTHKKKHRHSSYNWLRSWFFVYFLSGCCYCCLMLFGCGGGGGGGGGRGCYFFFFLRGNHSGAISSWNVFTPESRAEGVLFTCYTGT